MKNFEELKKNFREVVLADGTKVSIGNLGMLLRVRGTGRKKLRMLAEGVRAATGNEVLWENI